MFRTFAKRGFSTATYKVIKRNAIECPVVRGIAYSFNSKDSNSDLTNYSDRLYQPFPKGTSEIVEGIIKDREKEITKESRQTVALNSTGVIATMTLIYKMSLFFDSYYVSSFYVSLLTMNNIYSHIADLSRFESERFEKNTQDSITLKFNSDTDMTRKLGEISGLDDVEWYEFDIGDKDISGTKIHWIFE